MVSEMRPRNACITLPLPSTLQLGMVLLTLDCLSWMLRGRKSLSISLEKGHPAPGTQKVKGSHGSTLWSLDNLSPGGEKRDVSTEVWPSWDPGPSSHAPENSTGTSVAPFWLSSREQRIQKWLSPGQFVPDSPCFLCTAHKFLSVDAPKIIACSWFVSQTDRAPCPPVTAQWKETIWWYIPPEEDVTQLELGKYRIQTRRTKRSLWLHYTVHQIQDASPELCKMTVKVG